MFALLIMDLFFFS